MPRELNLGRSLLFGGLAAWEAAAAGCTSCDLIYGGRLNDGLFDGYAYAAFAITPLVAAGAGILV